MQTLNNEHTGFYPALKTFSAQLENEFDEIPAGRKADLTAISEYISNSIAQSKTCPLVFICVHNSRRSHFGQAWAYAAALYYGVSGIEVFSGGTEVTALHPNAAATLQRAGFELEKGSEPTNPVYKLSAGEGMPGIDLYSKLYNAPENPQSGFAAIMVCGEGDEACPLVAGAEKRFLIPYKDPKASDGTAQEQETYDLRCRQVAREVFYMFSNVKNK